MKKINSNIFLWVILPVTTAILILLYRNRKKWGKNAPDSSNPEIPENYGETDKNNKGKYPLKDMSLPLNDISEMFKKCQIKYGKRVSFWAEKIYRLETTNFTSLQFRRSLSAGQIASLYSVNKYPYGWTSMEALWDSDESFRPLPNHVYMDENNGGLKNAPFINYKNFRAGLFSLCEYIKKYIDTPEGVARWKRDGMEDEDKEVRRIYLNKLSGIKNIYVTGVVFD